MSAGGGGLAAGMKKWIDSRPRAPPFLVLNADNIKARSQYYIKYNKNI